VAARSFVNCLLLVAVSLLPVPLRLDTGWYGGVAALAGLALLVRAGQFLRPATRDAAAGRLFFATIYYLPVVLLALVADRIAFF
jgi:protoheme IX farnesyltransferase